MRWENLGTAALGLAALAMSALLPPTAPYALPAGIGLLGLALPRPGDLFRRPPEPPSSSGAK